MGQKVSQLHPRQSVSQKKIDLTDIDLLVHSFFFFWLRRVAHGILVP